MIYITALYWSGSMNVKSLRYHKTRDKAKKRLEELLPEAHYVSMMRCYEVHEDKPPKLVTHTFGLKDLREIS